MSTRFISAAGSFHGGNYGADDEHNRTPASRTGDTVLAIRWPDPGQSADGKLRDIFAAFAPPLRLAALERGPACSNECYQGNHAQIACQSWAARRPASRSLYPRTAKNPA